MSASMPCSVNDCTRLSEHAGGQSAGLCRGHAHRLRVTGKVGPAEFAPRRNRYAHVAGTVCTVQGCDRPGKSADGYCSAHYQRVRAHGHPGSATVDDRRSASDPAPLTCSVDGCDTGTIAKGLCAMHYQRKRVTGDAGNAGPLSRECWVVGCNIEVYVRGLCSMHYQRQLSTGDVGPVRRKKRTSGEGGTSHGYVYVTTDEVLPSGAKRRIAEHRMVMAEHIGRDLFADETPHHKNGDRGDNRIDNLELWSTAQPAGQRVADKIAFAREILARYADLPSDLLEVSE